MRRNPGESLRDRFVNKLAAGAIFGSGGVGWFCGAWAMAYAEDWTGWLGAAVLFVCAGWAIVSGWSLGNLRKGARSEEDVGQAIDYGLVRRGCAAAHGVVDVAGVVGDVDHVVLTTGGLWVVETKTSRVPREEFRKVLARMGRNAIALRRWSGMDVVVRGALVFGGKRPPGVAKRVYEAGGVEVRVFENREALVRALRADAEGPGQVRLGLADRVWRLGKARPPVF